tara:strand:+ start:102 stop:755 length:654 start_codon:yes stop_codon:yes gene_type:complete
MNLFPTLVVDDFLDDPDYVCNLAKNAEYNDPGHTNHPGVASKLKIHEIDQKLFDTILQKILGYYWDLNYPVNYMVDMEFQRIQSNDEGILNKGIIHVDSEMAMAAGLIYLNHDAPRDTGTSFYKLKDKSYRIKQKELLDPIAKYHAGEHVDGIEKICQDHYDKFEETMRVQNQYNRLLFYSGDEWHTATSYDNQTRYTLRYFISELKSNHQNFPLLR